MEGIEQEISCYNKLYAALTWCVEKRDRQRKAFFPSFCLATRPWSSSAEAHTRESMLFLSASLSLCFFASPLCSFFVSFLLGAVVFWLVYVAAYVCLFRRVAGCPFGGVGVGAGNRYKHRLSLLKGGRAQEQKGLELDRRVLRLVRAACWAIQVRHHPEKGRRAVIYSLSWRGHLYQQSP